jgi:Fic family protein
MAVLYDSPTDMEPLLPEDQDGSLLASASRMMAGAARLENAFRPHTRAQVAKLVRSMNGYYSNLIEGHRTKPHDIERALRKDFSDTKEVREKQLLHVAHVEAQQTMEQLNLRPEELLTVESICRIHQELYSRLPEEMRFIEDPRQGRIEVIPGALRTGEVSVGRHVAPLNTALGSILHRFADFYRIEAVASEPRSLLAAMSSHHRLVWIHPFEDGNGRVARLFSHLWIATVGGGGEGLWTLSRGLARNLAKYRLVLDAADEKRMNDFDGRGYLSARRLHEFSAFMLETSLGQVEFMSKLLDIGNTENRLAGFIRVREEAGDLPKGSHLVLKQVLLEDEINRGDVARILGVSPRTAQPVVGQLLDDGFLESPSPKGVLRLAFPEKLLPFLFPDLYPVGSPGHDDEGVASPV